MSPPLLRVDGVTCGYFPGIDILQDVTVEVPAGTVVGMIGLNGAGKSTLMRAVCGFLPVRRGRRPVGRRARFGAMRRMRLRIGGARTAVSGTLVAIRGHERVSCPGGHSSSHVPDPAAFRFNELCSSRDRDRTWARGSCRAYTQGLRAAVTLSPIPADTVPGSRQPARAGRRAARPTIVCGPASTVDLPE